MLEYSDDLSSVAKNSFQYLDTNASRANTNLGFEARRLQTAAAANASGIIPMNRYSFFEELRDRMLPPMHSSITAR